MINVVLVSYDDERQLLFVGKKRPNGSVEIINAIPGEEATELFNKLITASKGDK